MKNSTLFNLRGIPALLNATKLGLAIYQHGFSNMNPQKISFKKLQQETGLYKSILQQLQKVNEKGN